MESPIPLFNNNNFPGMGNTVNALKQLPTLERTSSETSSHNSTPKTQSNKSASLPPSYKPLIEPQQLSAPPAYKPNSPYSPYSFKPPSINLPSSREEISAILACDGNVKKIYTTTDGSFFSGEMMSTDFFFNKILETRIWALVIYYFSYKKMYCICGYSKRKYCMD